MFSSSVNSGDLATAAQYNNVRKDAGLFSGTNVSFTYNIDGTVNTVTHADYGITLTFTYNTDGSVNTATDGTNTWTWNYTNHVLTSVTGPY